MLSLEHKNLNVLLFNLCNQAPFEHCSRILNLKMMAEKVINGNGNYQKNPLNWVNDLFLLILSDGIHESQLKMKCIAYI